MNKRSVYIGFDSREQIAYEVCAHSILQHSSSVTIHPLQHGELRRKGIFRRAWLTEAASGQRIDLVDGRPFSTEFSHSRFLVPYLNEYSDWAVFMDCDMLVTEDIGELFNLCDDKYAVMVVKHNHIPKKQIKMDNQVQVAYPRKNWSSFILWNCAHPANRKLGPEIVNFAMGRDLHAFFWLKDEEIGELDAAWNWIEETTAPEVKPKIIHYTAGGPWFEKCKDVAYADLWTKAYGAWLESELKKLA